MSRIHPTTKMCLRPGLLLLFLSGFLLAGPQAVQSKLFSPATQFEIGGGSIQSSVSGDFNQDGKPDLAVTNGPGDTISVVLGDGKGGFGEPTRFTVTNSLAGFLAKGDFDRDGNLDLVVVNSRNSLALLRGDGKGGFEKGRLIAIIQDGQTVAVGDFNHDGKLDLAVTTSKERGLAVLLGDGEGGFGHEARFSVGGESPARHIVADDFNRDGNLDLAMTLQFDDRVAILLGDGTGGFSEPGGYQLPPQSLPRGLAAGDFNKDGIPDLAVVASSKLSTIYILLGDGTGGVRLHQTKKGQMVSWSITTADVNRDGFLDLVTDSLRQRIIVYYGQSGGLFSAPLFYHYPAGGPTDEFFNTVVAEDFNLDGFPDVAAVTEGTQSAYLLLNTLTQYPLTSFDEDFYRKKTVMQVQTMMASAHDPDVVFVATANQGIYRSKDGGKSFQTINYGIKNMLAFALAVDPRIPGTAYLGSWGAGVYKTTDGGDTWTEMNRGLSNTAVNGILIDPENTQNLYISTTAGLFESRNGASSWTAISIPGGVRPISNDFIVPSFLLIPENPRRILIGSEGGFFSWLIEEKQVSKLKGPASEDFITALQYDPGKKRVLAGTKKNGLFQSPDGGKTWTPWGGTLGSEIRANFILPSREPGVYFIIDHWKRMIRSRDGGESWQEINEGMTAHDIRSLSINSENPGVLYAGTYSDGLFISKNQGETWKAVTDVEEMNVEKLIDIIIETEKLVVHNVPAPPEFGKCNVCHGWT
ncbi:MAG TPA: FG-GAP-like repeat-containing protein, partial [Nitrospiria bacterium]